MGDRVVWTGSQKKPVARKRRRTGRESDRQLVVASPLPHHPV